MTEYDKKRKNEIAKYIGNNIYTNRKKKKVIYLQTIFMK